MKMFSKSTFLAGVTAALLGFSVSAAAVAPSGFTGDYVVGNWTSTLGQGLIDLSGAPNSITLTGADNQDGLAHTTSFTIAASSAATVSFDWVYHTNDSFTDGSITTKDPYWDPASFVNITAGTNTQLHTDGTGNGGPGAVIDQSGSRSGPLSFFVGSGQVFGFSVLSRDGLNGAAQLTISNFNVTPTSPVPEPGSLAMLTAGLLVVVAARKRNQA